ncbi:MAG: aldehyde dehydrogenase family protein, partial [Candidatus Nitrosopolaris sp.]
TIDSQVKDSVKEGAEILTGGEQIKSKGYFYKPTILKNVSTNMRVAHEEVFGPVAPIIVADDEIDAVRLANDSHSMALEQAYGLKTLIKQRNCQEWLGLA